MKTLTELTYISKDSCAVRFSDGDELRLSPATARDFSLFPGKELSDDECAALCAAADLDDAKSRALRLIGYRAMSSNELIKKLSEKGVSPENAQTAAEWLAELHFLDDGAYAEMVVRQYAAKGYGAARVKNELYRRGVPREFWDEALMEMPSQDEKIDSLLRTKLGSSEPDRAEMKRATDALFRRGFSWSEISAAVRRYREDEEG